MTFTFSSRIFCLFVALASSRTSHFHREMENQSHSRKKKQDGGGFEKSRSDSSEMDGFVGFGNVFERLPSFEAVGPDFGGKYDVG